MESQAVNYLSLGLSVASIVMTVINHKRVRSTCCGKVAEMSLDIDNTSPALKLPPPPPEGVAIVVGSAQGR